MRIAEKSLSGTVRETGCYIPNPDNTCSNSVTQNIELCFKQPNLPANISKPEINPKSGNQI
jgi:hypothetical protein